MQRRLGSRLLTVLLVLMAFATGCEKKRVSRFVQGDGEYVYAIGDFKGKTYTLKTGKKRTPGVTTRADELVVAPGSEVIRSFNSVDFTLETDIGDFSSATMNNFDFYGREDSEYKVQVDFTEQKLVFFELAKKEEIPSNVVTYAEEVGNGLYRVPLFGLPLNKVTIERIKDDRGKSTNSIRTISKKFLSEATHFLVNVNTPAYFDSEMKLDMLPSNFFDESNQWFYELTVVDKPIALDRSGLELGYQLGAGKVRFAKTNNSVLAVDLNIADEAEGQDAEKLNVIFEIPVQWMDYRLVKSGDNAYLKEEAFNTIEQGAKFWKDRQYALLQLDRVLNIDAASTNNIKIKRLEVGDDYFSFVIYDSLSKYSLHYSFAKKNEVVPGKVYPREDWRKFGFFVSQKKLYSGQLNASESTISRSLVQNRMIPPDRTVKFHITDNTPTDPIFLEAIQEAVTGWNWAFAEAAKGTKYESDPIKVELDLSKPVKNCDARYHKVSFYGYEVESGLLGYGPSVSDKRNGEVFSSTNHIYLRNYRESIVGNLVNYIRYKLGAYAGLDVDGITVPNQILAVDSNQGYDFGASSGGAVSQTAGSGDMFSALPGKTDSEGMPVLDLAQLSKSNVAEHTAALTSMTKKQDMVDKQIVADSSENSMYKNFISARKRLDSGASTEQEFMKFMKTAHDKDEKTGQTCEMLAATSLTFQEIEDVCGSKGTEFSDYVKQLEDRVASGEKIYRLESEREVLLNCAQKLMKPTLIATLAHEFGHNFALRHNFQGSADAANFARDANGVPLSRMASVMDYSHSDADRGTRPAPYDIAAIRYGYYDAVEVVDKSTGESKMVDIAAKSVGDLRPLEQRVAESTDGNRFTPRPFAYCTDGDIAGDTAQIGKATPFCERWDQGADPVTKVRSSIDNLVTTMVTNGNRFDMENVSAPGNMAARAISRSLGAVRNIYDNYRFLLYNAGKTNDAETGTKGIDDPYFDSLTEQAMEIQVLTKAVYDQANALVAELRNDPTMKTELLEKKLNQFPEKRRELAQYKVASELIKDFMIELVFSDTNYCVALHNNGSGYEFVDAEPLATVRSKSFYLNRVDSARCEDMIEYFVTKTADSQNAKVTIDKIVSVGNPFNSVPYSANPEVLAIRNNIRAGNSGIRTVAIGYLAARTAFGESIFDSYVYDAPIISAGMATASNNNFHPSLFDGESFRTRYITKLKERMANGVSVATLAGYADKKLKAAENKSVTVPQAFKGRSLPFFQEEKDMLRYAWLAYRVGGPSPRSAIESKVTSTQISSLPIDNFIGFNGPQRYTEYLVSTSGMAYFTSGADAVALMRAFSATDNTLKAIVQKKAMEVDPQRLQVEQNNFDRKVTNLLAGYLLAPVKMSDHYHSLNDVMYQVRICVLNTLVKDYGLNKTSFASLNNQSGPDDPFSIPTYCEAPRTGDAEQMTKFEAQFVDQAQTFINYVKADKKFTDSYALEQVLNKIGLPSAPSAQADPEETLTAIFKANDSIGAEFVGLDYASDRLSPLENTVAKNAVAKYQAQSALPNGNLDLASLVAEARAEEFAKLKLDEPYVTYLNDKLELLRNVIFAQ